MSIFTSSSDTTHLLASSRSWVESIVRIEIQSSQGRESHSGTTSHSTKPSFTPWQIIFVGFPLTTSSLMSSSFVRPETFMASREFFTVLSASSFPLDKGVWYFNPLPFTRQETQCERELDHFFLRVIFRGIIFNVYPNVE